MQKKIIALAVVAAAFSAPAFADVTPYGILDAAVVSVSADGQKSDLLGYSGGLSTSRVGLKISEDLGDGLTAAGVLEYALDTQTSDTVGNARQEYVALAGSFGTVASGYLQTTGYDFAAKYDPVAGSLVSPLQSVAKGGGFLIGTTAGAARAQRALAYISPSMGGLSFALNYSTALAGTDLGAASSATTGLKSTAVLASASYAEGPISAGLVYAGTGNENAGGATTSEYALGGSYDLGVAKILATYQSSKASTATKDNTAMSLSGVIPLGNDALALTYASNTMATANSNGTGYTVGYLRTVSKTVTGYAAYHSVTNGSGTNVYSVVGNALGGGTTAQGGSGTTTTLTNGGSSSIIAVGLRKKF